MLSQKTLGFPFCDRSALLRTYVGCVITFLELFLKTNFTGGNNTRYNYFLRTHQTNNIWLKHLYPDGHKITLVFLLLRTRTGKNATLYIITILGTLFL